MRVKPSDFLLQGTITTVSSISPHIILDLLVPFPNQLILVSDMVQLQLMQHCVLPHAYYYNIRKSVAISLHSDIAALM